MAEFYDEPSRLIKVLFSKQNKRSKTKRNAVNVIKAQDLE
jgi:hypothetical protein